MKKNKITTILLIFYMIFANNSLYILAESNTVRPESEIASSADISALEKDKYEKPEISAQSAILIDANTGMILYDKDCHKKMYPASITKSMTALLAIENTEKNDILTHSHNAVYNIGEGSSHIGMRENEKITVEQALYGILLASANEVCMAMAEHIDGTVEAFTEHMNKRAEELGCTDTHFNNPHGFHDENHYTTAYDMALIFKEAIKYEDFITYISTASYQIPPTNIVNETRWLNNSNQLIQPWSTYYYEYCVGGKTGFTDEAGHTLATYAEKDGIKLISVVLKDEGTYTYTDTISLMDYGFSLYSPVSIYKTSDFSETSNVEQHYTYKEETRKRDIGKVKLCIKDDIEINLPAFVDTEKITPAISYQQVLEAPVRSGDKIGTITFLYEGMTLTSADIFSAESIEKTPNEVFQTEDRREEIINILLMVVLSVFCVSTVILIIVFCLRFRANRNRRKFYTRRRRKRIHRQ